MRRIADSRVIARRADLSGCGGKKGERYIPRRIFICQPACYALVISCRYIYLARSADNARLLFLLIGPWWIAGCSQRQAVLT